MEKLPTDKHKNSVENPVHLTRRGKVLAAAGLLSVGAAIGAVGNAEFAAHKADQKLYNQLTNEDALKLYEKGKIDHDKVIKLNITQHSTAWDLADKINANKHGALQTLTDEISHQVGVEANPGETVVVGRDLVNEEWQAQADKIGNEGKG